MYKLVLVEFPYTEKPLKKKRPALLLTDTPHGKYRIVIVAYVTSRRGEDIASEVAIKSSETSGLTKDSIVKLHKLAAIPKSAIRGELGYTDDITDQEIKEKLKRIFEL